LPVSGSRSGAPPSLIRPGKVLLLLAAAFCLVAFLAGCRKRPTDRQVRQITAELAEAARRATGGKATMAVRAERAREGLRESLAIRLDSAARLRALEQALEAVARRHRMTREAEKSRPGELRFSYRQSGRITHAVEIFWPALPAEIRAETGPRLAIIIDDLGYSQPDAEAVLRLPFRLTVSVLPDLPHSREIAEEARRRGYQVLLHLPMEPEGSDRRGEARELRPGMGQAAVAQMIAAMLATVPPAVGVNNHQGSLATADPELMAETMRVLRTRRLFFIDSRTTTATVGYRAAREAGVPAAYRKVFLDDVPSREAVLRQLRRAARLARAQGWSIAIGHPHPVTLEALREALPEFQRENIRLVFASDLAR
jgi:uncharacterized protein